MPTRTTLALILASLPLAMAGAAPGDYDPAYDHSGGYVTLTLDERVAKLEKKLSGENQAELLNRVEQLQGDVLRLRGEVEDLTHRLETARKQNKDQYLDLDRRVQALTPVPPAPEPAPADEPPPPQDPNAQTTTLPVTPPPAPVVPPPAPTYAPVAPPPPVASVVRPVEAAKPGSPTFAASTRSTPPPAAPTADAEARQAAYLKGFNVFKDGKYGDAIKEFKNFLAAYPKGEYSDSATYWLAESQYINRDLAAARESFRKVVKDYPQAAKVSDAQLKLGFIDYDTGNWGAARETLNEVVKRYPDTTAAKLAQKRLDKMQGEGH